MLHRFESDIRGVEVPARMPWPFHYEASALSVVARDELLRLIAADEQLSASLSEGKMLGVLVVRDAGGEPGYLAAFSGNVGGRNRHQLFVPPIYDLLDEEGEFKRGERELAAINERVARLERSPELRASRERVAAAEESRDHEIADYKRLMSTAKAERDRRRTAGAAEAALTAESQYQKAELRRLRHRWREALAPLEAEVAAKEAEIALLRHERKARSEALQRRLFRLYRVSNAQGERSDVLSIFEQYVHRLPPSGTGECCAPKLLEYAYRHGLTPVTMAEFWYGASPAGEVRHHGAFYPSCRSKCLPLLSFMLRGLPVEGNPLAESRVETSAVKVLYRDSEIVVVDKPARMLSVGGKESVPSLVDHVAELIGVEPLPAHRLDMATSGVMVLALNAAAQKELRRQFAMREVEKEYVAVVEGAVRPSRGEIRLPLRPDVDDRPRQRVDYEHGKEAVTRYEVVAEEGWLTRVVFRPFTGRTHQLRVHAAHREGLNAPIVGDELYGHASERLLLHARRLAFRHPSTGERLAFESEVPF